jgi:hypothetical protein
MIGRNYEFAREIPYPKVANGQLIRDDILLYCFVKSLKPSDKKTHATTAAASSSSNTAPATGDPSNTTASTAKAPALKSRVFTASECMNEEIDPIDETKVLTTHAGIEVPDVD